MTSFAYPRVISPANHASLSDAIDEAISSGYPLQLDPITYTVTEQKTASLTANQRLVIRGSTKSTYESSGTAWTNAGSVISFEPTSHDKVWLHIKGASDQVAAQIHLSGFTVYCNGGGTYRTGGIKIGDTDYGVAMPGNYNVLENISIVNADYYGLQIIDSRGFFFSNVYCDQRDGFTVQSPPQTALSIRATATASAASFCGDMIFDRCVFEGVGVTDGITSELYCGAKASGDPNRVSGVHFRHCGWSGGKHGLLIWDGNNTVKGKTNDIFVEAGCAFDGTLSDADVLNAIRCEMYGELNDLLVGPGVYINSYNGSALDMYGYSGSTISNVSCSGNFIGRTVLPAVAFTTLGTGRSIMVSDNTFMDINLSASTGANGNEISYFAGDIQEIIINGNTHNLQGTMTNTHAPEFLATFAGGSPDYLVMVGNGGRWNSSSHYSGTVTNNAVANNLYRAG